MCVRGVCVFKIHNQKRLRGCEAWAETYVAIMSKENQLEYFEVEEHQNCWGIPLNYVL